MLFLVLFSTAVLPARQREMRRRNSCSYCARQLWASMKISWARTAKSFVVNWESYSLILRILIWRHGGEKVKVDQFNDWQLLNLQFAAVHAKTTNQSNEKKKTQNKHRITSRNNLTQAARRHSAGSVPFSASSLLLTEWRVERRPLVGYRGRRFQLAKRADRTTTVKFPLSVFHHYTSIIHIHKMITCKFSPMGKNQEQRPSQLLYTVGTN